MLKISDARGHLPQNVIRGALRLGGGMHYDLPVIPKLLQPA